MQTASLPVDEPTRIAALHALDVLDTAPEEEFDALVRVASLVCGVPMAVISLVDCDRQWFKAQLGLPEVTQTPRDVSFCAHAILQDSILEVPDASQDPRFADNPLVTGEPDVRFYAGTPLVLEDGHKVGTLCVLDRKPRVLSTLQKDTLLSLATAAARALEGRAAMRRQKSVSQVLQSAYEKAELASQSKGQFLANMSHEIRTPMNAVLGMLELLHKTELSARQLDYVQKAEGAAEFLLGLLNDILDFSKIEAGHMTLEQVPFRTESILRNLSAILAATVGTKPIEVLYDIDTGLPPALVGDAMRLQQVLINLAGNAIKFTSQGQVVISAKRAVQNSEAITIDFAVQDTGIGIAPEHQTHIFEGFSQAESSTTRRFGGTGLGLAICKHLVQAMGGRLALQSQLGVGTTFSFSLTFPIAHEPGKKDAHAKPSLAMQRVLVVDDNYIAAQLMQGMVDAWGWPVDWVDSGASALARIAQGVDQGTPYDVVFVDWNMPGIDGWETCKRIRHWCEQAQMAQPVLIMVTANGRSTLAHRTAQEQALLSGFLVKPVTASMLYDVVADAISGQTGLRALGKSRGRSRQLQGMRVLVVEDNTINQQVAYELLSGEGALVSIAANGQLGVDAVASAVPPFDVVLMDIHMPVMDGYVATQTIRQQLGLRDLPIIAMTANALAGDRERCLAVGMNEHMGKPFDLRQLVSLLLRITAYVVPVETADETAIPLALAPLPAGQPPVADPLAAALDVAAALERMAGMRSLYVRIAQAFCESVDASLEELRCLLRDQNREGAQRLFHTLKGNAATLGAHALSQQAAELEGYCKCGADLAVCGAALPDLTRLLYTTQEQLALVMADWGFAH